MALMLARLTVPPIEPRMAPPLEPILLPVPPAFFRPVRMIPPGALLLAVAAVRLDQPFDFSSIQRRRRFALRPGAPMPALVCAAGGRRGARDASRASAAASFLHQFGWSDT
jgi:hypothetical protein